MMVIRINALMPEFAKTHAKPNIGKGDTLYGVRVL